MSAYVAGVRPSPLFEIANVLVQTCIEMRGSKNVRVSSFGEFPRPHTPEASFSGLIALLAGAEEGSQEGGNGNDGG